jgi:hypothetical protein
MKQKLLLIILPTLLFCATIQAQKVWDFSNETIWPLTSGIPALGGAIVVDQLTLQPHTSSDNFGEVAASAVDFGDGFVSTNRFRTNGSAGGTPELPIRRFLKFTVSGACDVKIWYVAGGTSSRTLYVSDGATLINSVTTNTDPDPAVPGTLTASYTGSGGDIYISGSNNYSLYKIEVTGATVLGLNKNKVVTTNIQSAGNRIYVSDVKTAAEINIYSITGALVKSIKTNQDTDFSFKSGLWIATVKTSEGQKSVKLLVK